MCVVLRRPKKKSVPCTGAEGGILISIKFLLGLELGQEYKGGKKETQGDTRQCHVLSVCVIGR